MYFQQGYNYSEYSPDGKTPLGGGCQASSLLIALRIVNNNPSISMSAIEQEAKQLGLSFFDPIYSTRISYVAVPIIAASLLKQSKVNLFLSSTRKELDETKPETFFHIEAIKFYTNPPKLKNLKILMGVNDSSQLNEIKICLEQEGLVIPLVNTNIIQGSEDLETENFMHAVIIDRFEKDKGFHIIDPSPGFTHLPEFKEERAQGTFKVQANTMNAQEAKEFAKEYHPRKDIEYSVDERTLLSSLRGAITTII